MKKNGLGSKESDRGGQLLRRRMIERKAVRQYLIGTIIDSTIWFIAGAAVYRNLHFLGFLP